MQAKRKDPLYQAQAILSVRDHSEAEVRTKLVRKGFSPQQVGEAIHWLKENNLIDDRKFAFVLAENTLRFKAVGPRWLYAKLREKGIVPALIDEVVGETFSEGLEEEILKKAAEQWKRQHRARAQDPQRLTRFLLSRGFSADVVREYVRRSD